MEKTIKNGLADSIAQQAMTFRKPSWFKEVWRRLKKDKLAMTGFWIVVALLIAVIVVSLFIPYEQVVNMTMSDKLQKPSSQHLFGTDAMGRDMLARCLYGGRVSLAVSFAASAVAVIIGVILGAMVGYYGGAFDSIVMRFMDLLGSIPTMLLAMALLAAFGSGVVNIGIALVLASFPQYVRILRSIVLGISGQEYIEAAQAGGIGNFAIILKHVIPNTIGPMIVAVTMNIAQLILATASLSFLGLGVNPPQPEWGALVNDAREYLRMYPYLMYFPAGLVCISSFAMNILGDGLRDALDPRLRN